MFQLIGMRRHKRFIPEGGALVEITDGRAGLGSSSARAPISTTSSSGVLDPTSTIRIEERFLVSAAVTGRVAAA